MRIPPLFLMLSIVQSALILSSCTRSSNSETKTSRSEYTGPVAKGDWLITRLPSNPESLNDIIASDMYSRAVTGYIFESLISYDTQTGEPVPRIAESWTVSDNGLEYEFTIREGIEFHDGEPLSVEDVKFSFDLIRDPKVNAPHLQNYYQSLEKVEVTGERTIKMTMAQPYFRNLIMLGLLRIYPKHLYGQGDFNKHPLNRKPVASGPYRFASWEDGQRIEVVRFENWWGWNDPYWKDFYNFDRVQWKIIVEEAAALLALKNQDIDIMSPNMDQFLNALNSPEVKNHFNRLQYSTDDGAGYNYIGFNLSKDLFKSKNVRLALAKAMPRQQLNENLYSGQMKLSVGPFPQTSSKTDPDLNPIEYDLPGALELLEKDGWEDRDGDGLLDKDGKAFQFELLIRAQHEIAEKYALNFQSSLKRLGIQLNLRRLEWTVMLKNIDEKKFDTVLIGWGASLDSDPYQVWHSSQAKSGGSNFVGFQNTRVDEIVSQARSILDREKRNVLYREFSRIVAEEVPYIFLFENPQLLVAHNRFQGIEPVGKLGVDSDRFFTPPSLQKYK